MRNIKQRFVIVIGIFVTFFLPFQVALADPAKEMGCILRQPGGAAKFVRGDLPNKKAIAEAALNAHRLQGAKVIDPCLTGQMRNIPASIYAKLAEKYPEKFQPLETSDQSIASQAATKKAPNVALEYHYVDFNETMMPETAFSPSAITNDSRVHGDFVEFLDEPPFSTTYAAVFEHGAVTILRGSKGFSTATVNERGMRGGFVLTDFENFFGQAALFDGNEVQLIPRLPGEISSLVLLLNDPGVALILSFDENFNGTLALYKNGKVTPVDFGPDIPFTTFPSGMNNQEIIVGRTSIEGFGDRGFRFDPRTGVATLLEPLSTETHSWAMGINNRGDVLGYSFEFGAIERIGVWDKHGKFHTYFVEGIPEFPTISNQLSFNDNNQIVITLVTSPLSERGNSYLVPKPGVRLNLADLVTDEPPGPFPLSFISGINNVGNIIGFGFNGSFLLERRDLGVK